MTNPISSDGNLASQGVKQQKTDARGQTASPRADDSNRLQSDEANVSRGQQMMHQQRLSAGEAGGMIRPETVSQYLEALLDKIEQQPRIALAAHGQANDTIFEAAMSAPA